MPFRKSFTKGFVLFCLLASLCYSLQIYAQSEKLTKQGYLQKYFGKLCQQKSRATATLYVDGSPLRILAILPRNYAITKAGKLNSQQMFEVEWQRKRFSAIWIGKDPINDLLLLKIQSPKELPSFDVQRKISIPIGSWAISLGPQGFLKGGIVSAIHRDVRPNPRGGLLSIYGMLGLTGSGPKRSYKDVIQHDGPVENKYLGSPLINSKGELLGINISFAYRGTGFAVSREYLRKILPKLKNMAKKKAFLGVFLAETPKGLQVTNL
ncbi:MAG: serine protease, partial [Planctomycetota bacterium]